MSADRIALPAERRIRKWKVRGDTGALVEEYDEASSVLGGYGENTAHDDGAGAGDVTVIADATIPAGKKLVANYINITNDEAYNVQVVVYDGTSQAGTLIDRFNVGAFSTAGVSGVYWGEFATSVVFFTNSQNEVQGGAGTAWANGTSVRVSGILVDT